jgi:hypothetical protein
MRRWWADRSVAVRVLVLLICGAALASATYLLIAQPDDGEVGYPGAVFVAFFVVLYALVAVAGVLAAEYAVRGLRRRRFGDRTRS